MSEDSDLPTGRHDLVGGPFAVIESDPGVFTSLIRKLGVRGLEVTELYSIEAFATDHLNPYGLIFCYLCEDGDTKNEFGAGDELDDPDAQAIWFANQLSDDACSSQAILNVLLNCRGVDIGPDLRAFAADTEKMSPVMRGLAISNSPHIRNAQNSLARPADIRGAQHALATATLDVAKSKAKAKANTATFAVGLPPAAKKRKTSGATRTKTTAASASNTDKLEAYHYIGYVPAHGRVWELDGLHSGGSLDVGPLDVDADADPRNPSANGAASRAGWMDVVRPALQRRMQSLEGHIQYNLLAIVDDAYMRASDELELLKRERAALERRLGDAFPAGWADKVDPTLLASAKETFSTTLRPEDSELGKVFAPDFGSRKMDKELEILDKATRSLAPAWETCVKAAFPAKIAVEEEISKSRNAQTDHVKRTFDYELFIQEFITCLEHEGLLEGVLNQRAGNAQSAATPSKAKPKGRPKSKKTT